MRIVQLNLNHCREAQDILYQNVRELKTDIAILSEPYNNDNGAAWVSDLSGKAAIWACQNVLFTRTMTNKENGFVWVCVDGVFIYSCYAPPSMTIEEYGVLLDRLVSNARGQRPLIIAGDFNAWAVDWGCRRTSPRGRMLIDALMALDVVLVNEGTTHTFQRAGMGSVIDVTFMSENLARRETDWKVSDIYTHSDHQIIVFTVNGARQPGPKVVPRRMGWRSATFDEALFKLMMADANDVQGTACDKAQASIKYITKACDAAMVRRSIRRGRPPVYWWNEEIAQLRTDCNKVRRLYQRSRGRENFITLQLRYRLARRQLKSAIITSKQKCFKDLCMEVDRDPWGRPYRVVMGKLKPTRLRPPTCPNLMLNIVTTLFPRQAEGHYNFDQLVVDDVIPPISKEELLMACRKMSNNKAPGLDNIPNIALRVAINAQPDIFARMYDACLREGVFPKQWKVQKLVLIPKGQKPPDEPSSYRPICLLDSAGKLFERVIYNRLEQYIESNGGLSEHQYGFRKSRSTLDAIKMVIERAQKAIEGKRWKRGPKKYCAVVALDIKNAFNSASWIQIHRALEGLGTPGYIRRIIGDYLNDRLLRYDTEAGIKNYTVNGGVPQGSVLGPLLWNIMYDGVLRLPVPEGATIIGFADDIAIVVSAKFTEEVTNICNRIISTIRRWLESSGLKLAAHKTEVVLISSRKIRESITIRVGQEEINSKPWIKYLGVIIDDKLSFRQHIEYCSNKGSGVGLALAKIMPNIGGPRQNSRTLMANVVTSVMLYGAPIWVDALQVKSLARKIESVYRSSLLRVATAFRTVSYDAVCVIAGMVPISILAKERLRSYLARNGALNVIRAESITEWQRRWTTSEKGRWTHRLIPQIDRWVYRRHGKVDFYLTQFLSGHGCFRAYLHKFGHDSSPECPACTGVEEDVEHVFFHCPRFLEDRETLERALGERPSRDSIVSLMLESEEKWVAVGIAATNVMKELRHAERQRAGEIQES